MRLEWQLRIWPGFSLRLPLLWLLAPCLVVLLLALPLWIDGAHRVEGMGDSLFLRPALNAETAGGSGHPADASSARHCALHCAPQVLFPALLLCAALLPLATPCLCATTRFHSCLGLAPPVPPPQHP